MTDHAGHMENTKVNPDSQGDLSRNMTREDLLQRIQTAENVWLPRDVFETLYLNPERKVAGDLRQKVGFHHICKASIALLEMRRKLILPPTVR